MKKIQLPLILFLRVTKTKMRNKMQKAFALCTVTLFLLFLALSGMAQTNEFNRCGTMDGLEIYYRIHPEAKALAERNMKLFAPEITKGPGQNSLVIVTIPVVFHIVSNAARQAQVTDADVIWQLNKMNEDFTGSNADSTNAAYGFYPIRAKNGYCQIRYCLAQRTPGDLPTNGIDRVVSTLTGAQNCADYNADGVVSNIKHAGTGGADAWDPNRYFNIWVAEFDGSCSGGGLLGIATFPGTGAADEQGIAINFSGFSNNPVYAASAYALGRTAVHEAGHYWGLLHIWGDESGCTNSDFRQLTGTCLLPASLAGTTTDQTIGDTPNQAGQVTSCPSGERTDACSGSAPGINYQNYMDYTADACYSMFTIKQVDRMQWILDNCRASLKTSNGCSPVCVAPTISCPSDITVSNTTGQCGANVSYPSATATGSPAPTITYSKASGSFFAVGTTTVTATATNSCGTATCTFTVTVNDVQAPSITCPGNISVNNDAGVCGAVVTYTTPVGTDNCPGAITTRIAGLASGSSFPVGTTTNTFRVTDAAGLTATCSFTVTVSDNEDPVISAPPVLSCFEANNFGCSINLGASATDNCGVQSLTSNAPPCFPVGTTTVTWTATDIYGNSSTKTQAVTRNPEINIDICAGITRTIYAGTCAGVGPFGPQSINLSAIASGGSPGFTYSWSPATGLNDPNIANPVASPTVTTTYVLTVTDTKGCTRSLGITINVLPLCADVCSDNGNNVKFNVCHVPTEPPYTPNNICIKGSAVPAHLIPGATGHNNCTLGPCGQQLCFSTTSSSFQKDITSAEKIKAVETKDGFNVFAYPNPTTSDFSIQVTSKSNEPVTVRLLDVTGVIKGVGMNN
ncbi:MAG: HYR domain-containing protein, partial [Ferruginibacter sp.]